MTRNEKRKAIIAAIQEYAKCQAAIGAYNVRASREACTNGVTIDKYLEYIRTCNQWYEWSKDAERTLESLGYPVK